MSTEKETDLTEKPKPPTVADLLKEDKIPPPPSNFRNPPNKKNPAIIISLCFTLIIATSAIFIALNLQKEVNKTKQQINTITKILTDINKKLDTSSQDNKKELTGIKTNPTTITKKEKSPTFKQGIKKQ